MTAPTADDIPHIIEFYHRPAYRTITDYNKVFDTAEEITVNNETITKYSAPGQDIYLNSEGYAVTYGRQKVDTVNNKYLYNFTDDDNPEDEDMAYEYVAPYEWAKTETPIPHPDGEEES